MSDTPVEEMPLDAALTEDGRGKTEVIRLGPPMIRPQLSRLAANVRPLGLPLGIAGLVMALYGQAQIHAQKDATPNGWLLAVGALYFGIGLADVAIEKPWSVERGANRRIRSAA